ncbi:MAG TPA: hypothetical protein VM658_09320 [bacterium]|nr:hypothetical protein [bacterium]
MKTHLKIVAPALFILLLAAGAAPQASRLVVEVNDSADSPGCLLVQVSRVFPSGKIPAPSAQIKISDGAGYSRDFTTDLMGRAFIPLQDLAAVSPAGAAVNLTVSASAGDEQAQLNYQLIPADVQAKILDTMKLLSESGKSQVSAKDYAGAQNTYQKMHELDPSSKAALYDLGLACEKNNRPREALAAYLQYLASPGSAADQQIQASGLRFASRRRPQGTVSQFTVIENIIRLEKTLSPRLAISADAQARFKQAADLAAAGNMKDALAAYEKIELQCPWWSEPYYAAGIAAEYLTYHRDFSSIDQAVRNFSLFMAAAAPEDQARKDDVKARLADLQAVKNYPPGGAR